MNRKDKAHKRFRALLETLLLISITSLILHVTCSVVDLSGSGTEEGNVVSGIIRDKSGNISTRTIVELIPAQYNPLNDPPIPASMKDTTDDVGQYVIRVSGTGLYNIQAVQRTMRTRVLVTGIHVQNDTTIVPDAQLTDPGSVKLFLPDTIDTARGVVFVEGTRIQKSLTSATQDSTGEYSIVIDSIPAVTLPTLHYDKLNNPLQPIQLSDTIDIVSNDTALTEAFVYWTRYHSGNSGLNVNTIRGILIAPDGKVWFATYRGVAVFDGSTWTAYTSGNSGLQSSIIWDLFRDHRGNMWFAEEDTGVAVFDGVNWISYNSKNSMLTRRIWGIDQDSDNNLWFAGDMGIAKLNTADTTWALYDTSNSDLRSNDLTDIIVDSDNAIWFTSFNGVGKFDGITWTIYDQNNSSMPQDGAMDVYIDSKGDVYFGTFNGWVAKFDGTNWTTFEGSAQNPFGSQVEFILEDSRGNMWYGSQDVMTMHNGQRWKDFVGERYPLLDGRWVHAIAEDSQGDFWVATGNYGVVRFGPKVK